jgi:alpha-amylase/alpha-mannosidase (GH57 family)
MNNMEFCVHGHFYQPPREDPLTGEIPIEPGAAPYRNWNERINAQCYRPNAQLGNFGQISFNVGPTLMEWMEKHDPETLRLIVEQERRTLEKYGVGNGMAQCYNHTILPLASLEDKFTQVRWGIADFEYHFGHEPQGMWLPETAADDETLWVLAECGIQFTILAPWQASSDCLDASQPYKVLLPGTSTLGPGAPDHEIAVFFYNQDLSTRISFDPGATVNADRFVLENLLPKYQTHKGSAIIPQMVMVASDGELYGHHQPFRDKFLSYLMDGALSAQPISSTFPALWLRDHPVKDAIRIQQKSSWSCHHGVTRWMGACGCTSNSDWKEPLREALIEIGDLVDQQYLEVAGRYLDDPWELRHQYIHVIKGTTTLEELVLSLADHPVHSQALRDLRLLLRAEYERQRMFTSCGWFFDDFDRIEPRNNVAYAAQAVLLTEKAMEVDLTQQSLAALSKVRSWRTNLTADEIFRRHLQRAYKAWK